MKNKDLANEDFTDVIADICDLTESYLECISECETPKEVTKETKEFVKALKLYARLS